MAYAQFLKSVEGPGLLMKAIILRKENVSLEGVEQVEIPAPEAGINDVLIRIFPASLNYRDYLVVTNNYSTAALDEDLVLLSSAAGARVILLSSET